MKEKEEQKVQDTKEVKVESEYELFEVSLPNAVIVAVFVLFLPESLCPMNSVMSLGNA